MSIGSKLKLLIDYRHTNVNKLAKSAEVSPQTIYGIIKRDNTKVDIDILQALANELNVTLDYFATGEANANTIVEEEMMSSFKKLDDHGRKIVQVVMDVEISRIEAETDTLQEVPRQHEGSPPGMINAYDT